MNRPVTSASNLHRRKACPGSERMERGLPDEESEQSIEGRLLHGYDANPSLDRSVLKPYQQDLLRISEGLDNLVLERVYSQFSIGASEQYEGGREEELEVLGDESELLLPGHTDFWRYWGGIKALLIIDKKFGYKVVTPAVANLQLRGYAMAGAQRWDSDYVVVAVTQPRLSFDERLTLAIYSREDLARAKGELVDILDKNSDPEAPLIAGEDQCRYCKAKLICPAYSEKYTRIQTRADRSIAECNDDQLDQILQAIKFAGFIEEQAKDEARRRIAAGLMTMYKLGKESEVREVADARKAKALFALRGDITDSDFLDCVSLAIGTLEEKVRKRKGCTWKVAKEIVNETLAAVIEKKTRRPSIIREA